MCVRAQSCPTLCDPMDCSPPGSSVTKFSRQEYWSGLPFPPSGDLPDPGTEPKSLASPALAAGFFTTAPPGKPHSDKYMYMNIHNGIFTVARKWKQTKYPLMGER